MCAVHLLLERIYLEDAQQLLVVYMIRLGWITTRSSFIVVLDFSPGSHRGHRLWLFGDLQGPSYGLSLSFCSALPQPWISLDGLLIRGARLSRLDIASEGRQPERLAVGQTHRFADPLEHQQ